MQIKYATGQLHYPVWGMSPSSSADDTRNYGGFGVEGLTFPYYGTGADASHPNEGLLQCHGCATKDVVTTHAAFLALDVTPQQVYANIDENIGLDFEIPPGFHLTAVLPRLKRPEIGEPSL